MKLAVKILGLSLGTYAAFRMSGVGIEWLKEFFDAISPRKTK